MLLWIRLGNGCPIHLLTPKGQIPFISGLFQMVGVPTKSTSTMKKGPLVVWDGLSGMTNYLATWGHGKKEFVFFSWLICFLQVVLLILSFQRYTLLCCAWNRLSGISKYARRFFFTNIPFRRSPKLLKHQSGQIIIFHQPRFPYNKGISRPKRYPLTRKKSEWIRTWSRRHGTGKLLSIESTSFEGF